MPRRNPRKCDLCGKKITFETWVRSKWTESYYCRDITACAARVKRKKGAPV